MSREGNCDWNQLWGFIERLARIHKKDKTAE